MTDRSAMNRYVVAAAVWCVAAVIVAYAYVTVAHLED